MAPNLNTLFRSEPMQHCQMLLHVESAFECLVQLGYMGLVQFINTPRADDDANTKYLNEIQRCNEMLRLIKQLETEAHEAGMRSVYYPEVDLEDVPRLIDMKDIEQKIHTLADDLSEIDRNLSALKRREMALKEEYHVLNHVQDVLHGQHNTERIMAWSDSVIMNLIRDESSHFARDFRVNDQKLRFYAGTIPVERFASFETMLFRVCQHNFFIQKDLVPEPLNDAHGVARRKLAFMVVFVGERIGERIQKVCSGFRVKCLPVPESNSDRQAAIENTQSDLKDLKKIFERTNFEREQILAVAAGDLFAWKVKVLKMLAVYTQMHNMIVVEEPNNHKYLKSSCWVPRKDIKKVRKGLLRGARRAGGGDMSMMFAPTLLPRPYTKGMGEPPTSIEQNKFTKPFQKLVDAYGIPNYQELNPAPYTIITFPFLFGVMFGDVGHGLVMFTFAAWMVRNENEFLEEKKKVKKTNEIWDLLFAGRYIILMMGIYSIYIGLIYNDCFSKSLNFFGSSWRVNEVQRDAMDEASLNPAKADNFIGTPYIMGIDPVWRIADETSIIFMNSYKMKLSIILGVVHMVFGLVLFASNSMYFHNAVDFYFIFIPQLTFLLALFGYLVFLIIFKWWTYGGHYNTPYNSACAPSLLVDFINMVLMKDPEKSPRGCENELYNGQSVIQMLLVIIGLLTVPILLAGKPLHYMRKQRKIRKLEDANIRTELRRKTADGIQRSLIYQIEDDDDHGKKKEDAENIDLTELWIHSGIHTIECVLGAVSHTASYLRLWALSLAHDQLSHVLWFFMLSKPFCADMGYAGSLFVSVAFLPWAAFTVAIMVVMEGLSAFLHCLRLHWVEFQSKFYSGAGELFSPFQFKKASNVDLI